MDIKQSFKDNLQTIIAIFAIASSVFGVFNFYILAQLTPITQRVAALESWKTEIKQDIKDIPVMENKIANIEDGVNDLKRYWGIK